MSAIGRRALLLGGAAAAAAATGLGVWAARRPRARAGAPNVVVVLTDDQGLNDLGCYYTPPDAAGAAPIRTPNLDGLATQGVRLTTFYVGASICTPSRAALLTGCYPPRVGFGAKGDGPGVLTPQSRDGLPPGEATLAELFRAAGYATACVGKWHLGHLPPYRPTSQGFDEFYGIPWSNNQAPLALWRNDERLRPIDADTPLVAPFTEEAVSFVARNADRPFFLYLAHSAPHEPWAVSPGFVGRSERGRYGDEVEEIDAHVGALLGALDRLGLAERTLVVFLSDNGPWLDGPPGGSAWPLRAGKSTSFEGGFRSPCLLRWPDRLPAGRVEPGLVAAMDLLPTLARVCGLRLPGVPIDGVDVWDTLATGAPSPRSSFAYYARGRLEAVRDDRWKRMFAVPIRQPPVPDALFDLRSDPREAEDRLAGEPAVVAALDRLAEGFREDLGDALRGRVGVGVRSP